MKKGILSVILASVILLSGCYYFPVIEAMTGAHVAIDRHEDAGYSSAAAATLLSGRDNMPDIISPTNFGVMDPADDGLIVPPDDYKVKALRQTLSLSKKSF